MVARFERVIHGFIERPGIIHAEPGKVGIRVPAERLGRTIVVDVTREPVKSIYSDRLLRTWVTSTHKKDDSEALVLANGYRSSIRFLWNEDESEVSVSFRRMELPQAQFLGSFHFLDEDHPAAMVSLFSGAYRVLCVRAGGNNWNYEISPLLNSNSLVSGSHVVGGPFRDNITARADSMWLKHLDVWTRT